MSCMCVAWRFFLRWFSVLIFVAIVSSSLLLLALLALSKSSAISRSMLAISFSTLWIW
ncbi:hypothetical protein [Thermococcus sp.]